MVKESDYEKKLQKLEASGKDVNKKFKLNGGNFMKKHAECFLNSVQELLKMMIMTEKMICKYKRRAMMSWKIIVKQ